MPIYEYECQGCKNKYEEMRKVDDRHNSQCPSCGGREIRLCIQSTFSRDWFRPHLNEDFPNGPVYVESKQHYRKLCKEQGVEARCLM